MPTYAGLGQHVLLLMKGNVLFVNQVSINDILSSKTSFVSVTQCHIFKMLI